MNVLSRRCFSVLLVTLVAFMSLFFTGCASDEEKFIKLSDEFDKIEDDYGKVLEKFDWPGQPSKKIYALKSYKRLESLMAKNETVVKELKAVVEKQKAVVEKMKPLGQKTLALKERVELYERQYLNHADTLKSREGTLEHYKEIMRDPNSRYNKSKATGFTDVPGFNGFNTWK